MSDVTNLEVLIQIREELAGLKKTRTELQGAKQDAGKLGEALKQGLGIGTGMQMVTMAVSALKSGLQSTVGEAFRLAGELKDTSEALGISTTDLQVFRLELQDAGMEVGRLSMAIAEQNRSLAEARDSGSGAAQAYRALRLNAAEIERMPVAERILAVVRAANTAEDRILAFSAASQILGGKDLPRLLAALDGLATRGAPAATALYDAQGRLLSPEAIARIDAAEKSWKAFYQSIVTGTGEALGGMMKVNAEMDKARSDATAAAGGGFWAEFWNAKQAPTLVDLAIGAVKGTGPIAASGASSSGTSSEPGAAQATTDNTAADAQARRLAITTQLAAAQANLAQIQATAVTNEANEALTAEQKAAEKRVSLENEITQRKEIIALLGQAQQADFSSQAEKDAAMAKEQEELLRAKNALAAQGNTAAQQQARQLFDLETQALAAEAAGNTRIAEQKREQIKALQLAAQLEGQAPALVDARIAADRQLTEAQRTRARSELDFSRSIGQIEQQMALVEADNSLTERERQAKLLPLLEERNRLTAAHIALLEQDTRLQQGDQTALELQKTIDDLRAQIAEGQAKAAAAAGPETLEMRDQKGLRDMSDPSQHYQSVESGIGGAAAGAVAQLGTDGDIAAAAVRDNLNSALSDSVSWLDQLASGAITFQEFWSGAIGYVGQMFRKMAVEMVAKMIWQHTVGRALTAISVAFHVQGEATKTAATQQGGAMRLLVWIKEAVVSVYKGAIAAFDALASIPYVGPFLGAAAMAAAIAGGMSLIGKMGKKDGGYGPDVGVNQVAGVYHGGEWIAPNWMVEHPQFGPMIEMLEAARTGSASAADLLSADVTGGIAAPIMQMQASQAAAAPAAAGGSGSGEPINLHVGVMSKQREAADFFSSAEGQKVLIDANKKHARLYG